LHSFAISIRELFSEFAFVFCLDFTGSNYAIFAALQLRLMSVCTVLYLSCCCFGGQTK